MPIVSKVAPEIAATWDAKPATPAGPRDDRYDWATRPARIFIGGRPRSLRLTPRVCDVLRLRASNGTPCEQITGIVLDVRVCADTVWTHALLAIAGEERWVTKSTIAAHLGRARGLTRVDQPTKRINDRVHGGLHAWFVRIYAGTAPMLAKTFSDRAAGGKLAALRAALAYYTANIEDAEAEGIVFL